MGYALTVSVHRLAEATDQIREFLDRGSDHHVLVVDGRRTLYVMLPASQLDRYYLESSIAQIEQGHRDYGERLARDKAKAAKEAPPKQCPLPLG